MPAFFPPGFERRFAVVLLGFLRYLTLLALLSALFACGGGASSGGEGSPTPQGAGTPQLSAVSAGTISASSVTISWTSNEPATAQVEYGTTASFGLATAEGGALATSHSVQLTGLMPGTTYHYRVRSRDADGNVMSSSAGTFMTGSAPPAADTTAPQVSNVLATTVTANGARIVWTTSEPATSAVEYGASSSYGSTTPESTTLTTNHSVQISGLAASRTYHYRVRSRDAAGNAGLSANLTFATTGSGSAMLTWDGPTSNVDDTPLTDLSGYRLYMSSTSGQYGNALREVAASTAGGTQQATVTGLSAGTYYFVVSAMDTSGNESARSNELRVVIP
jgi:phosphodiesterase/alkaline phosphatase D-like protein